MNLDDFFSNHTLSRKLFDAVQQEVKTLGDATVQVTKSQIAFKGQRTFAAVWRPSQYLKRKTAPLVLTIFLRRRDSSPRWKEVVEPAPGRFTHHLELHAVNDIDADVRNWLLEAWELA